MNNLSQECRNQIEMLSAEKYPHDIDGQYYFDEGAKEALTNPVIFQSAGLMPIEEGIIFGMWASVYVKGIMNNWLCLMHDNTVNTLPELLTIFRNQNKEK